MTCCGVALLAVGEVVARYGLGLGDPPLVILNSEIEYLAKPGEYHRFGNTVRVNSRHMRSPEFPEHKESTNEFRVMLLGDSVVNGGSLTDQSDLASERLRPLLEKTLDCPVTVGNISAGSWGPGNALAYVRRFGLANADVVVMVLNSRDIGDNPGAVPVEANDPALPQSRPLSALGEALTRYVLPRISRTLGQPTPVAYGSHASGEHEDDKAARAQSLDDLRQLVREVGRARAIPLIVHFPLRTEVTGELEAGGITIREFTAEQGLGFVDLRDELRAALDAGQEPYRRGDPIHPNAVGQELLANAVARAVTAISKDVGPDDQQAPAP